MHQMSLVGKDVGVHGGICRYSKHISQKMMDKVT